MSKNKDSSMSAREGEQVPEFPAWVQEFLEAHEIRDRTGVGNHQGDSDTDDDDDIPLATKRGLTFANFGANKARRVAQNEPSNAVHGDNGTAAWVNAQAGNTEQESLAVVVRRRIADLEAGTATHSAAANRRAPSDAEVNCSLQNLYGAARLVRPRYLLSDNTELRADMLARHFLDIQPRDHETDQIPDRLLFCGYARSAGLARPGHNLLRAYRLPSITLTNADPESGDSTPGSGVSGNHSDAEDGDGDGMGGYHSDHSY